MQKERLDKILSNLGFGTRMEVKRAILAGYVSVNDIVTKDSGKKCSLQDKIEIHGETLERKEFYYFMMNKAPDCITATEDSKAKTVIDYLSEKHQKMNLFPVGRLDKETEGLLILTTDGVWAHQYTSPKHLIEKEYYAEIDGEVTEADIQHFSSGVQLDDGYTTLPARLSIESVTNGTSKVKVWLKEGKYRQIRRMFTSLGKEVTYLKRIRMGVIQLDVNLPIGSYREFSEEEFLLVQNEKNQSKS
ncbi:pseudouridine synthase [Leptospira sp. 96542]|nr:pseudouridine synthase [Leptospira sp. 96542]